MAKTLAPAELVQYGRLGIFIERYRLKMNFKLDTGRVVKLKYTRHNHGILRRGNQKELATLRFDVDAPNGETNIPLGRLVMTPEYNMRNTTRDEDDAIKHINNLLAEAGGEVDIVIGAITYLGIKAAIKVTKDLHQRKGEVKADIMLVSNPRSPLSGTVIYISHKAPRKGANINMRQYGGLTEQSGLLDKLMLPDLKEIDDFHIDVETYIENERLSRPLKRRVKSKRIIQHCIYGIDFGGTHGFNNVHMVGQGKPLLKKFGEKYKLSFSNKTAIGGDVTPFMRDPDYYPVFAARYAADKKKRKKTGDEYMIVRGFKVYDITVKGARTDLYPANANEMKTALEI